ncbi:conserved hypothetical protein [Hyella patelloides LEGE 07179]|uniref:Sigma-70 family RNA polymerase sigma factor n=1 Tax=Hyella patelloides LEGE 07179 TaxID=945734 RepID=A0A563VSE9_9CYAN|nr:sigma-70 family RNA polymerase sigma factor [Hyella patelloides]VEP14384.1 conserved hypothetical protein [Hyella patelloides LEGE 07179]
MSEFSENNLNSKEREEYLKKLAIEAQKYPSQSSQRQLAISRLVNEIWQSPKLGHPQNGSWSVNFYTEVYHEALQRTLLEVCHRIDFYNPQHPVMAWVNFRLQKQFINVVNDYRKKGITNIPKIRQKETIFIPNLDDLDERLSVQKVSNDEVLLRQFIEQDPERLMGSEFVKNRPFITFQVLAKAKFIEERNWTELADEFDISPTTLCSFFNRRLKKLMPYFKKYLQA